MIIYNYRFLEGGNVPKTIRHIKTNVLFEVVSEEKKFYVVIKTDEPDIKLRLEKFAVDGKMFKLENKRKSTKEKSPEMQANSH